MTKPLVALTLLLLQVGTASAGRPNLGTIDQRLAGTQGGNMKAVVACDAPGVALSREFRSSVIAYERADDGSIFTEARDLVRLARLGIPTVPIRAIGYVTVIDQHGVSRRAEAMVMPRMSGSSKYLDAASRRTGEALAVQQAISPRTREDLVKIEAILKANQIGLHDFQFLVHHSGRVYVNDVHFEGTRYRSNDIIPHLLRDIDKVLIAKQAQAKRGERLGWLRRFLAPAHRSKPAQRPTITPIGAKRNWRHTLRWKSRRGK